MSLQKLRRDQLLELANEFEVEVDEGEATKPEIIAALQENNISFATWRKFFDEEDAKEEEPPAVEFKTKSSRVLLKMERHNATFEAYGYTFTRAHPFQVVDEDTAQLIIDQFPGFRLANPKEAANYYG